MKSFLQSFRFLKSARGLKTSHARIMRKTTSLPKTTQAYEQAYNLFDADGDGSITPEELISILTSLGESPGDLNLYFGGMATGTVTDHKQVVDFITFMIQNINQRRPEVAEAEIVAELSRYDPKNTSHISIDDLGDWIDLQAAHLTDDQIDHLIEGADIDGDGMINYIAYMHLICHRILKLDSKPLQQAYQHIDDNEDGEISREELFKSTGTTSEVFDKVDFDQSGSISFVEFLLSIFKTKDSGSIRQAFGEYDVDGSGVICVSDLRKWCMSNGCSEESAASLIDLFDFDGDGAINYEEFVHAVIKRQM